MLDDRTILYASHEPGTQTELINPNEIAAMAKKPAPRKPDHEDDHPMYVRMVLGSLAVLAVFALIIVGIMFANQRREQQVALYRTQCEQAMSGLESKRTAYTQLREGEGAQAGAISDIQVDNAATIRALDEQLSATMPELITCDVANAAQYHDRLQLIDEHSEWFDTHAASLQSAVDGVTASKRSKDLADRRETFSATLREVQTTLDLTRGNVADNVTWDDLSKLLASAQQAHDAGDMEHMEALEGELSAAVDRVNASRDQKIADDERKAAEQQRRAAEEKAKQEQQRAEQDKQKQQNQQKKD